MSAAAAADKLVQLNFRVYGRVQGVSFRAYTRDKARQLRLVGYVKNETNGSVAGKAIGPRPSIDQFRDWLTTTGSPHSTISNCECEVEEITSEQLPYDAFNVVH